MMKNRKLINYDLQNKVSKSLETSLKLQINDLHLSI